jgi:hypothetical protein
VYWLKGDLPRLTSQISVSSPSNNFEDDISEQRQAVAKDVVGMTDKMTRAATLESKPKAAAKVSPFGPAPTIRTSVFLFPSIDCISACKQTFTFSKSPRYCKHAYTQKVFHGIMSGRPIAE